MTLGKNAKIIISIVVAVVVLAAVVICVVLLTRDTENKWIPEVQGSHVDEIEYEDLDSIEVLAFDDFKTFEKSSFADTYIIPQKPVKEERYSEAYFEENNLVVIKFNFEYRGADFYVKEITSQKENFNTVTLLGMVDEQNDEKEESTYCCYVETAQEVTGVTYGLIIAQINYIGSEYTMIGEDNLPSEPQEGAMPVAYKIDAVEGIAEFAAHDGTLSKQNFILTLLNGKYGEEFFAGQSLLAIKVPSSDFISDYAKTDEEGKVILTSVRSNHYKYLKETKYYSLIIIPIDKDFSIAKMKSCVYNEYEDNLPSVASDTEYLLEKDVESSTANMSVYNSAEID